VERTIWGWFDATPVALRDPETGVVHPVRVTAAEADAAGLKKRRMIVFDTGDLLEVIPADAADVREFEPEDFCVYFHAPDSADWIVIRKRDGAKVRIQRELGLT
jgi:hypothetical protein